MKKSLWIFGVLLIILLISAIVAPILAQYMDYKFHRILSRCVMVQVLLIAVVYYARVDKTNISTVITHYGLQWQSKASSRALMQGFFTTFLILVALMVIEVIFGARYIHLNIKSTFLLQLVEYIGAAFIIGFIEELFFRGMIFKKARRVSLPFAFIITNMFYASVHFFKAKNVLISEIPTISDSFKVYWGLLQPFLDPINMLPGFIGLFIFGVVLSYTYWKTNSLYHSIGIHAGAVFFLKADGFLLNINDKAPVIIYGDKNVYTGVLGWIFMGLIGIVMWAILNNKGKKRSGTIA